MRVAYDLWLEAWVDHKRLTRDLAARPETTRVLDVGGGANPALPRDFIDANDLEFVLLDLSEDELAKAPASYTKVRGDITSSELRLQGPFDLVVSKSTAEHVARPRDFHENIFRLLAPGRRAVHFFPTLYAAPFVLNRLLPEAITDRVLVRHDPARASEGIEGKFEAYYRWCRGPTEAQCRRLEAVGFRVEEYRGYFGHEYYDRVKPLGAIERQIAKALVRRPVPWLTSYANVVLAKP